MSTISYLAFKTRIRKAIWPEPGEATNLVKAHDGHFNQAMYDLCKWVECLQENHTDVHPACSTYVECGKSLFDAPVGVISRVYTIANGDWCNRVNIESSNIWEIERWARNLLSSFRNPVNAGLPALQQGIRYVEAASDGKWGRSHTGLWAIYRKRFYLAPWLQSNESVVIEWDGQKRDWGDNDLIDLDYWTPDVESAVQLFVQWQHELDYGTDLEKELKLKRLYEENRAELIFWCSERTKQQVERTGSDVPERYQTGAEVADEAVPTTGPTVFAAIGDMGDDGPYEKLVADMVKSWDPAYVISTGDNWYGSTTDFAEMDLFIGKYYGQFIYPYTGIYTGGATEQRFYTAIGNHDLDPAGRLAMELEYFSMPGTFYDVVKGPIHFFFVSSGFNNSQVNVEPAGNTATSAQGIWLQTKLALSTAPFKVVVLHHPPYSSTKSAILVPPLAPDGTISFPDLQWPFTLWGADLVMCGHSHNYERLQGADGLYYLVNGGGGHPGQIANQPAIYNEVVSPLSQVRYNALFSAIRGEADCRSLKLDLYGTDGVIHDTLTITK